MSLLESHRIERLARRYAWVQTRKFMYTAVCFHVIAIGIGIWENRPTLGFHVMVSMWPIIYLGGLQMMGEPLEQLELTDRTIRQRFWRGRWWDYALLIVSQFLATGMVIAFDRSPNEPHLWWRAPIYACSGVFLPALYLEAIRSKIKARRLQQELNLQAD